MIYLACPYSDPDPKLRAARFNEVNKAAGSLMKQGLHVFSPISHSHPIVLVSDLPTGWDYWEPYDCEMLAPCNHLIVLMLNGWKESKGVQGEIRIATAMGIKISYWGSKGIKDSPEGEDAKLVVLS